MKKNSKTMRMILTMVCAIIVTAFTAFSCTDDNLQENTDREETVLMSMKSAAMYGRENDASSIVGGFVRGDTIGLFLPDYKYGDPFLYATRRDYGWDLSTPVSLGSQPTLLRAFYPYRQSEHSLLSEKRVLVEHTSQTDYMYGYSYDPVSRSNPKAVIVMKHALALLRLKFIRGGFDHDGGLSRIAVRNGEGSNCLHGRGWMHLEDGMVATDYYDCEPASLEREALPFEFIPEDDAGEQYIDILVMPVDYTVRTGDVLFEVEIDGWVYTCPLPAGTVWESGMSYTYLVEMLPRTQGEGLKRGTVSAPAEIRVVLTETKER